MPPIRVAVVGLGIGRRHIRAYQSLPGVEVAAIVDTDPVALDKARQEFGIGFATSDYSQVLARQDIGLLSICTPDKLHAQQALQALEAGKHVLCEKPMATTLEDAALLVRQVRETGLKLMVMHNYRFVPQFAKLKELADAGTLGSPYFAESCYIQDLYFMAELGPRYWRWADPQDFVLGGAVHNVDLLRWVFGEIIEVQAFSRHVMPFYALDDNYVVNLRFAGGGIGRLLLLLGSRLKDKFRVELNIYGPEGSLSANMQRPEVVENVSALQGDKPLVLAVEEVDSHQRAIAHFLECVREDKQPLVDVVEGAKAVAVCLAAILSAREGRPVAADYRF